MEALVLLGLSPGVGFATAALIIAVQQFLARIKTVLSNSGGDRNEQKVKLIAASIPLGLVFIAIAVAYFLYSRCLLLAVSGLSIYPFIGCLNDRFQ